MASQLTELPKVLVDANVVTNVGNDGIRVLGFEGYYGFDKVAGPQVSLLSEVSLPSWSAVITNNTVAQPRKSQAARTGSKFPVMMKSMLRTMRFPISLKMACLFRVLSTGP
jgi:hypothetical protein